MQSKGLWVNVVGVPQKANTYFLEKRANCTNKLKILESLYLDKLSLIWVKVGEGNWKETKQLVPRIC